MKLIKPNSRYQASYNAYVDELGDENRHPFPLDFDHRDFPALLDKIRHYETSDDLPEPFVPSSTFWLVEGGEIIGMSNLRHRLNAVLKQSGGHIGLGIRPSKRGLGLGSRLLQMTIDQARLMDIGDVHVHCYAHNQASANMIKACGGVLDSSTEEGGHQVLRFVISRSS
jgi:predicted acetyltransferase